jgi:hypothetical protein
MLGWPLGLSRCRQCGDTIGPHTRFTSPARDEGGTRRTARDTAQETRARYAGRSTASPRSHACWERARLGTLTGRREIPGTLGFGVKDIATRKYHVPRRRMVRLTTKENATVNATPSSGVVIQPVPIPTQLRSAQRPLRVHPPPRLWGRRPRYIPTDYIATEEVRRCPKSITSALSAAA